MLHIIYCHGKLKHRLVILLISAVCNPSCKNGGICESPGVCTCSSGWRGQFCNICTYYDRSILQWFGLLSLYVFYLQLFVLHRVFTMEPAQLMVHVAVQLSGKADTVKKVSIHSLTAVRLVTGGVMDYIIDLYINCSVVRRSIYLQNPIFLTQYLGVYSTNSLAHCCC